jgi:hypothetical protein
MMALAGLLVVSAQSFAVSELPHAYCGTLKDYGDSYQIIDGMFDVYLPQDNEAPADPKGVVKSIVANKLNNSCVCVIGIAESFDRGGETAYSFKQITGLKTCHDLVK